MKFSWEFSFCKNTFSQIWISDTLPLGVNFCGSQASSVLVLSMVLVYAVVQFYPWFNFYFPFVYTHYHTLPCRGKENNKGK